MAWDPTAFPDFEGEFREESGHSHTEQEQHRAKVASTVRQLTSKEGPLFGNTLPLPRTSNYQLVTLLLPLMKTKCTPSSAQLLMNP